MGKYKNFDIEYLPNCNRYFPRYKKQYLFWWHTSYKFTIQYSMDGCKYAYTISDAVRIIDRFLELRGVGTEIIEINDE